MRWSVKYLFGAKHNEYYSRQGDESSCLFRGFRFLPWITPALFPFAGEGGITVVHRVHALDGKERKQRTDQHADSLPRRGRHQCRLLRTVTQHNLCRQLTNNELQVEHRGKISTYGSSHIKSTDFWPSFHGLTDRYRIIHVTVVRNTFKMSHWPLFEVE